MSKGFIAELHDIGKLVDKNNLKSYSLSGHTFEDFDFSKHNITKPSSLSWWGQYHHRGFDKNKKQWVQFNHKKRNHISISEIDINEWPEIPEDYRPDLFLLILADHLASSISRQHLR